MTPAATENQRIQAATDYLGAYLKDRTRLPELYALEPKVGSVAERDHQAKDGTLADGIAFSILTSSEDHLQAAHFLLLQRSILCFAFYTLLRASLEAAARAWWILDPELSRANRLAAALTEWWHSYSEVSKIAPGELAHGRREELKLIARRHKTEPRFSKKRQTLSFGKHRPTTTRLIAEMFPEGGADNDAQAQGEFLYRFLSAATHATTWLLIAHAQQLNEPQAGLDDRVHARVDPNVDWILQSLSFGLEADRRALTRFANLYGWDTSGLGTLASVIPQL